ncbi:MAG: pilus assembly PilX N-terminal domain-containing protein [Candidatus Falkowbacteria bacterium]
MDHSNLKNDNRGSMIIIVLVLTGLFSIIAMGAIGLALLQQKLNLSKVASTQAIHIAEAGVNYYRWVLYHDHEEYCNNETCISAPPYGPYGPYEYKDSSGQNITGYYELYITPPPPNGSTIVKIKSVGWVANHPGNKRTIEVQCGIPAWSTYSTLANDTMRFGEGTEVWGPIHSNGGIRFDGIAHNVISSALLDYDDPDHNEVGTDVIEFGVHTHDDSGMGSYDSNEISNGANPPNPPLQDDIFLAGRQFPVSVVSFDMLNNYINNVYIKATTSGFVIDPRSAGTADPDSEPSYWGCISGACDEGIHITLKTDNTFDIRGVSALQPDCNNPSLSILAEEAVAQNFPIPTNGVIFIKNHVWVDGQIDGSRVTILAFFEPFTSDIANIVVNNDLLYTNYDGTDIIGLIAQHNIGPGLYSEGSLGAADDGELRIDAAMIAKEGRIGREYYISSCGAEFYKRDTITIYGSLSTDERYGFSWSCGVSDPWCSGYDIRNLIYDNNLTFAPPPHYPTTGEYTFISWKEE